MSTRTARSGAHRSLTLVLQAFLFLGAGLAVVQGRWLAAAATLGVIVVTLLPLLLERRLRVHIPPEFELLAVAFIYASLFLGEVRGYYVRFWWWDVLLHTGSGFLLGLLGFLFVHILNELENIELHMKPGFVAFFAFLFAVGMGVIWEIFEFSMDQIFGLNMQKTGLVDTMWDLIVDCLGAFVIAILGFRYLRRGNDESFLERWINSFIERNPHLFKLGTRSGRPRSR